MKPIVAKCYYRYFIFWEEYIMNKEKFCNECGKTLTEQNTMEFNGNAMCHDCYERLTVSCDNCGERIWASDAEGNGNVTVCIHCYDNYYTHCENCGVLVHCDSAFYEDNSDYPYCEHCYNARMEAPIKPYDNILFIFCFPLLSLLLLLPLFF